MNLPLSEKLRPKTFTDVVGQDHLIGSDGLLSKIISNGHPLSILLWGPPGSGKTTIARLYAKAFDGEFISLSAVIHSITDIKKIIAEQKKRPLLAKKLILFVDELHRFNKAQQDLFLPYLEDGTLILIGATTENPSFNLNNALLSRLRTLTLQTLTPDALKQILLRFQSSHQNLELTPEIIHQLIALAQGDGRHLINTLENLATLNPSEINLTTLQTLSQKKLAAYDRHDDHHFNLISALHKSIRGSDPDAALYYFARMLEGGEDPKYLGRRLIRMASEDIGLADPQALPHTLAAAQTYTQLGSPEGELALAQAVIYLALAPKSNAAYTAFKAAQKLATQTTQHNPPKIILNAPTTLMKKEGYGKDYKYDHDEPLAFSGQNYFPDELPRATFYQPKEVGYEREMKKRLAYFTSLRVKMY